MKAIKINNPEEFVMVLSKKKLEIIAHSLALHVEEVTIKDTKQEIIEILHVLAKNNIWGHANFWKEEIED